MGYSMRAPFAAHPSPAVGVPGPFVALPAQPPQQQLYAQPQQLGPGAYMQPHVVVVPAASAQLQPSYHQPAGVSAQLQPGYHQSRGQAYPGALTDAHFAGECMLACTCTPVQIMASVEPCPAPGCQ